MVLQPFMPTCLLGATRAASVEMSAEESFSTWTTGRPSGTNGCEYLAGAPLGTYWMVRPSARAAGDATRKSAAAAPAALEERELREGGEGERREGKEVSADRDGGRFSSSYPGFRYPLFRDPKPREARRRRRGEDTARRAVAEPDTRSMRRVDAESSRGSSSVLTADRDARGALRKEVGPGKRDRPLARGVRALALPRNMQARWARDLRGLLLLGGDLGGLNLGDSADGGVGGDGEHFLV